MPNVRDHDASVYLRLQGDALSVGGYEQNPIFWEEVGLSIMSVSGSYCKFLTLTFDKASIASVRFWQ